MTATANPQNKLQLNKAALRIYARSGRPKPHLSNCRSLAEISTGNDRHQGTRASYVNCHDFFSVFLTSSFSYNLYLRRRTTGTDIRTSSTEDECLIRFVGISVSYTIRDTMDPDKTSTDGGENMRGSMGEQPLLSTPDMDRRIRHAVSPKVHHHIPNLYDKSSSTVTLCPSSAVSTSSRTSIAVTSAMPKPPAHKKPWA
jgi:hypothetical protein